MKCIQFSLVSTIGLLGLLASNAFAATATAVKTPDRAVPATTVKTSDRAVTPAKSLSVSSSIVQPVLTNRINVVPVVRPVPLIIKCLDPVLVTWSNFMRGTYDGWSAPPPALTKAYVESLSGLRLLRSYFAAPGGTLLCEYSGNGQAISFSKVYSGPYSSCQQRSVGVYNCVR